MSIHISQCIYAWVSGLIVFPTSIYPFTKLQRQSEIREVSSPKQKANSYSKIVDQQPPSSCWGSNAGCLAKRDETSTLRRLGDMVNTRARSCRLSRLPGSEIPCENVKTNSAALSMLHPWGIERAAGRCRIDLYYAACGRGDTVDPAQTQ